MPTSLWQNRDISVHTSYNIPNNLLEQTRIYAWESLLELIIQGVNLLSLKSMFLYYARASVSIDIDTHSRVAMEHLVVSATKWKMLRIPKTLQIISGLNCGTAKA